MIERKFLINCISNLDFKDLLYFRAYIYQSGGFQASAKKGRGHVQYPNCERIQVKRFLWFKFYPKIEQGLTVFIARKPERKVLSTGEWLAIASCLATLTLTVNTLSNN